MLKVEAVVLGLAAIWSLLHGVQPENLQDASPGRCIVISAWNWLMGLDICWPLSMVATLGVLLALRPDLVTSDKSS
jgi:hypothetical protein